MTEDETIKLFAKYTAAKRKRLENILRSRNELIKEGVKPTVEAVMERAGMSSKGTVHHYLEIIAELEGQAPPDTAQKDETRKPEPFSGAVEQFTKDAKAQIDALGASFMATITVAVEEGQRQSQIMLQAQIEASQTELRGVNAEMAALRRNLSVIAEEADAYATKNEELEVKLRDSKEDGIRGCAALLETQSALQERTRELGVANDRIAIQDRWELQLRIDLEVERSERQAGQRELKEEASQRKETEMQLARTEEQLEARDRELAQALNELATALRRNALFEQKLYGFASPSVSENHPPAAC